jgi:hypothetical protein
MKPNPDRRLGLILWLIPITTNFLLDLVDFLRLVIPRDAEIPPVRVGVLGEQFSQFLECLSHVTVDIDAQLRFELEDERECNCGARGLLDGDEDLHFVGIKHALLVRISPASPLSSHFARWNSRLLRLTNATYPALQIFQSYSVPT